MAKGRRRTEEERDRVRRMKWWRRARFGMFVHWGLYSQVERGEWVMHRERFPLHEYEKLADTWQPKPRAAGDWARLARAAGMKYMVMTTKHHEGFCLWDTQQTDYNAVRRGPGRDLVREYVEACRRSGLKVGFYYSLMDWHHPDGWRCARSEKARRRFVDFTHGCVRELCSNYGKVDVLWYDVPAPLETAALWESEKMNRMVRRLQPDVIINDRSRMPEDFGTPEESIRAAAGGRAWEACMTFNGAGVWGYQPAPPEDWCSVRAVLGMLRRVTAGGGNLLLNIGPRADGSVPEEAVQRLAAVGKWLKKNGEAVYGDVTRADWWTTAMHSGAWTQKGRTAYFWCTSWPGRELAIGRVHGAVERASILSTGRAVEFEQTRERLVLKDLPARCPDRTAGVAVIKLEGKSKLSQRMGTGWTLA